MEFINLALFLVEAVLYFSVMTCFLHFRHKLGLGVFLTALGVMHFMETYLAAVFYIPLPFGVASPGSSVLFAGKLMMILMLYMKEDAAIVRQPIYGLFLGNLLTVAIAQLVKFHHVSTLTPGQPINTGFLDEMGILMVWGTAFLYLDHHPALRKAWNLPAQTHRAAFCHLWRHHPDIRPSGLLCRAELSL